jgi:SAM-dependent methyltransferase
VTWELFDREAERYEAWYATARGRRASRAETALLARLLEAFPGAQTVLDVGCGTGHFSAWLTGRGLRPIGLDRAPAMLGELRQRLPACPVVRGDAHALPVADRSVDLALLVTTLELLADPARALAEAARTARRGLIAIALNRWSAGALSRRFGRQAHGALLRHARDLSLCRMRALVEEAAGARLAGLHWRSALLPAPLPAGPTRIPLGDVIGVAAGLDRV